MSFPESSLHPTNVNISSNIQQKESLLIQVSHIVFETALKNQKLHIEKKKMNEELAKNSDLVKEFEMTSPYFDPMTKLIQQKKDELQDKYCQLISLQNLLTHQLENPPKMAKHDNSNKIILVSVLNKIQEIIINVCSSTIDQQSIDIPITDVFNVVILFTKLYDHLVKQNLIKETTEEKEKRETTLTQKQLQILDKLRANLTSTEEEEIVEKDQDISNDQNAEESQHIEENQHIE